MARELRQVVGLESLGTLVLLVPQNTQNIGHFLGEQVPQFFARLCAGWGLCTAADAGGGRNAVQVVLWSVHSRMKVATQSLQVWVYDMRRGSHSSGW